MLIEQRKNRILDLLDKIAEDKILAYFEDLLYKMVQESAILRYAKPLQDKINLSSLIQSQNYKTENVLALHGVLDDDEPFEELLKEL
ncbi:hypothetical protein V9L05_11120 [Bernardetia sp. Wsw4-3y2]|uniref:hypothetical protein n=1 Tax=Bernardetia sp. Wsw4-3y2 TaxID=3127471 RepID=UPI0030CF9813